MIMTAARACMQLEARHVTKPHMFNGSWMRDAEILAALFPAVFTDLKSDLRMSTLMCPGEGHKSSTAARQDPLARSKRWAGMSLLFRPGFEIRSWPGRLSSSFQFALGSERVCHRQGRLS